MGPEVKIGEITVQGEQVDLYTTSYATRNTAVIAKLKNGESYGILSTNINPPLGEEGGLFAVKAYSENLHLAKAASVSGLFEDMGYEDIRTNNRIWRVKIQNNLGSK